MLQTGHMLKNLGLPDPVVIEAYKLANQYRPHRCEAVYFLSEIYNAQGNYTKSYETIKTWYASPKPVEKDYLFNMDWIAEYGLRFQQSICSYYIGSYDESIKLCDQLLNTTSLPSSWRDLTVQNREYPLKKLKEKTKSSETAQKKTGT